MNIKNLAQLLLEEPRRHTIEWRNWWQCLRVAESDLLVDEWGWKPDWNCTDCCPLCRMPSEARMDDGVLSCTNRACAMHIGNHGRSWPYEIHPVMSEVTRLTKERDELRSLCEELAGALMLSVPMVDTGLADSGFCPVCDAHCEHANDCTVAAALSRYREWKEKNQ